MWQAVLKFIKEYGGNPLVVAVVTALLTLLLNKLIPSLFHKVQPLGGWLPALLGRRWRDYRFERRYLDWLIGRHRFLGQLPSNVAVATSERSAPVAELEQIYVALSITPGGASVAGQVERDILGEAAELTKGKHPVWRRLLPGRMRRTEPYPQSDVGRAIAQQSRLVIRGDPGSGKTTLMRYLAVTCARSLRNNRREGDDQKLTFKRLGWKKRLFPIIVSLGRHGQLAGWEKGHTLLDACAEEFGFELEDCPEGFFERQLRRGDCLILLDAFDELGTREARAQMARHISALWSRSPGAHNRILVTTRIVGYEGQLDACEFAVRTVQPLRDMDIDALVRQRYHAIALSESSERSPEEANLAERRNAQKAERLLAELRHNRRLHELAVNPLLLSLIVLDHSVKLTLPEERHILYRDCVEILAARWRQYHRAELGLPSEEDRDLTLTGKISLLQAIALYAQLQRTKSDLSQMPISRTRVEEIIAGKLPDLLAASLPSDPRTRDALCRQKATACLDSIKTESGVLVELGFDNTGEPVISFSHLTFQEYLAASALKEQPGLSQLLMDSLSNPAWEEVVLLYVAMMQDATPLVRQVLSMASQDSGAWLFAARCLMEHAVIAEAERKAVRDGLSGLIRSGPEEQRIRGCELLARIPEVSVPLLLEVAENDRAWAVRYAAAQALGRLGDPRFEHDEPQMVTVPAGDFMMGSDHDEEEKPVRRITLPEYCIGKYPVTNAEYKWFLDHAGHPAPEGWNEGNYPAGRANHPVVYVSWDDAVAYCAWLSQATGKVYRLPTEAEWEKAARGTDGREYSWGNDFNSALCNSSESGIGTTTPVGIYHEGASSCGAMDMAGNVWEWVADWHAGYNPREISNPRGPNTGSYRVLRGGSWFYDARDCRSAYRNANPPAARYGNFGFRPARSLTSSL